MPIFIGGTGRSGTSHLSKIIGEHPLIWSPKQESRFIIDAGGIENVVKILSEKYTHLDSDDCLRRLKYLLTVRLKGKEESAFAIWDHENNFGKENYNQFISELFDKLTDYEYIEATPYSVLGKILSTTRTVGKYFPKRSELITILRDKIGTLFDKATQANGKKDWCEKTPFNFLSFPFLLELFPNSKLIHIMRHPLYVVASYKDSAQTWAPNDILQVCKLLEPIYRRWLDFKKHTNINYIELRLENICQDWKKSRANLFNSLGLPDYKTPSEMKAEYIKHHGETLTKQEEEIVREKLGFAMSLLGYK